MQAKDKWIKIPVTTQSLNIFVNNSKGFRQMNKSVDLNPRYCYFDVFHKRRERELDPFVIPVFNEQTKVVKRTLNTRSAPLRSRCQTFFRIPKHFPYCCVVGFQINDLKKETSQ